MWLSIAIGKLVMVIMKPEQKAVVMVVLQRASVMKRDY